MYLSTGQKACLETILCLSQEPLKHDATDSRGLSTVLLKKAYNRTLHRRQPLVPRDLNALTTQFVVDYQTERKLAALFAVDNPLNDLRQQEVIESGVHSQDVSVGELEVVRTLLAESKDLDGGIWRWFTFIVNSVFCSHSQLASAGTTSSAVGIIWINRPSQFSTRDLKELLVHELTHNLMFLDEWRYGHYKDYKILEQQRYYALSPILGRLRPLDKVIHALVVATELLLLRERHIGHFPNGSRHNSSETLCIGIQNTIKSLHSIPNIADILTERTFSIIELCEQTLGFAHIQRRPTHSA
jgi:hypothetical protein